MSEYTVKMLALFIVSLAYADDLTYTDQERSVKYDWSTLQRPDADPWKLTTGDDLFIESTYYFNIGKDLDRSCSTDSVSVIEVVELFGDLFETCQVVGRHQMWDVKLMDKTNPNVGIELTYGGGDRCSEEGYAFSGSPRSITFRLYCSNIEDDWQFTEEDELGACTAIVEKYTKAGCPTPVSVAWSKAWKAFIWVLGGVIVYVMLGLLYNISKGKTGVDAVPSFRFWSDLPEKVKDGMGSTSVKLKSMVSKVPSSVPGSSRSYELI